MNMETTPFFVRAREPLGVTNFHWAAKSVAVSSCHVAAALMSNSTRLINNTSMVCVCASSIRCDFIIQSPVAF